MIDRELLEKAAKASDLVLSDEWDGVDEGILIGYGNGDLTVWNPLDDDGDAFRLAVSLKINLEVHPRYPYVAAFAPGLLLNKFEEPVNDDPYAAARRAIVHAAAAMGKESE